MLIKIINKNLTYNQHWKNSITYIITSNVEVLNKITLKIDDNTNILLLNNSLSSIIFNEGSKLFAKNIISFGITSYDMFSYIPATTQLNGGWNFMGNNNSKFRINEFKGAYLGSSTLSAITVTDINENKLKINKIKLKSCTNNINLINSSIKIKKIKICDGVNGFNLTNSFLNITNKFNVSLITIGNLIYESLHTNILINKRAYFSLVAMNAEPVVQNVVSISNDQNVNGVNPPYNLTNINKLKELLNITID